MSELEVRNVKIASTSLGFEGHGIMTWWVTLEWDGGGVSLGGYALGGQSGIDSIEEILKTVGVENWEELKGKYVVLESEGWGGRALGIRNILKEDKWFRPKEWFATRVEEKK